MIPGGEGRGGSGKDEGSDWRRMLMYVRCVCFGCAGKDQKMGNFSEEDNCSCSLQAPEGNSLLHLKEKKKLNTILLETTSIMPASVSKSECCSYPVIHPRGSLEDEDSAIRVVGDVIVRTRQSLPVTKRSQLMTSEAIAAAAGKTKPLQPTTTDATETTTKDSQPHLDLQYTTQAFKTMESIQLWSFNIFKLNHLTNGRSLYYMTLHLFHRYDFLSTFSLSFDRLVRCVTLIESSYYFSNPYHNSVHAADVVQAMFVHLTETQLESSLTPVEKMAAILSAVCHDVDHPGTNQGFLIATSNPLCALYHNVSVLENHHWRTTVGILHESRLFEHLDRPTWRRLKSLIQSMILATDITQQAAVLAVFKDYLDQSNLNLSSDEQHRSFILQITLKCADISNPCRHWELSKCWSQLICEEFYRQGDREQQLGLPVTAFCDRKKSSIANIQTGFMTHVAEPLFVEWNRFLSTDNSRTMLENLRSNRSRWESIARQADLCPSAKVIESGASSEGRLVIDERSQGQGRDNLGLAINRSGEIVENSSSAPTEHPVDADSDDLQIEGHRRNDLPVTSSACHHIRRLSLPARDCPNHPDFFSLISTICPVLCLSAEDKISPPSKVKGHCVLVKDNTLSSLLRTSSPGGKSHPDQNSVGCSDEVGGGLCCERNNHCSLPNGGSSNLTGRWRMVRKMSLIAPRDHQTVTVIIGRKRSRSLVTSTLACAFEDSFCSDADGGKVGNGGATTPDRLGANSASAGGGGLLTTWWQKNVKNSFCRTKILPPQNSDSCCCQDECNSEQHTPAPVAPLPTSPNSQTPSSVHLLTCPVLVSRVLEVNFRAPKVTSRKTSSMFTPSPSTEDAEAVPLLEPGGGGGGGGGGSVWHNDL